MKKLLPKKKPGELCPVVSIEEARKRKAKEKEQRILKRILDSVPKW